VRRLSRNNNLRLGIVLMVTGLIALGHWGFGATNHLSAEWDLIIGVVLVVLGIPFLVVALRYNSGKGGPSGPPGQETPDGGGANH
jgi:hypothetical protein